MAIPPDSIVFESPHFPVCEDTRRAVARALAKMPGAKYARGGTHAPEFFAALSEPDKKTQSFETQSFEKFAECKRRHDKDAPSERWWSADEMAHMYGWGDWDRDAPTGMYHAFFCPPDVSSSAVRDFVLEAFPRKSVHVVARMKHMRGYRVFPPISDFEGLSVTQRIRKLRDVATKQPLHMHEYDPDVEIAAMLAMRRDWPSVLVIDGILDGDPEIGKDYDPTGRGVCLHMETMLRQPLTFVLVFRGDGVVRSVVEAEGGRAPRHDPIMPTEEELQAVRDRERRASGARASTSAPRMMC